eukprot:NODE_41_length_34096_cov_2.002235.p19 type:complete len:242 gc:universal NODE_41_length_34096_cov_2.002235:33162-33887(+)
MKYLVWVVGCAGSGKSTFVKEFVNAFRSKNCHAVNMDPAVKEVKYNCSVDIRDLITVEDAMEELNLGPNGALLYCFEYLLKNLDWISDNFNFEADFLVCDCPGQIELYSHLNIMPTLIALFENMGYQQLVLHITDVQHISSPNRFWSAQLNVISSMMLMGLPHLSLLTKCDIHKEYKSYLKTQYSISDSSFTNKLVATLEEHIGFQWLPIDYSDEHSIKNLIVLMDMSLGFGEHDEIVENC